MDTPSPPPAKKKKRHDDDDGRVPVQVQVQVKAPQNGSNIIEKVRHQTFDIRSLFCSSASSPAVATVAAVKTTQKQQGDDDNNKDKVSQEKSDSVTGTGCLVVTPDEKLRAQRSGGRGIIEAPAPIKMRAYGDNEGGNEGGNEGDSDGDSEGDSDGDSDKAGNENNNPKKMKEGEGEMVNVSASSDYVDLTGEGDFDDEEINGFVGELTQTVEEGVEVNREINLSQHDIDYYFVDRQREEANQNNSIVEIFPKDEDKMQEISIWYGATKRKMKLSEAYVSKKDKTKIYAIDEFFSGEARRKAECRLFQKIEDTFLKGEGKVLKDKFPYVMHESPMTIYVDMLGEKVEKPPLSSSSLIYGEDSLIASCEKFGVTYQFKKTGSLSQSQKDLSRPSVLELYCGAGKSLGKMS